MDTCQRPSCGSARLLRLRCKCSDCCSYSVGGKEKVGYAPKIPHVTGTDEDYVFFVVCLSCGQVQGKFPVVSPKMDEED